MFATVCPVDLEESIIGKGAYINGLLYTISGVERFRPVSTLHPYKGEEIGLLVGNKPHHPDACGCRKCRRRQATPHYTRRKK